MGNKRNRRSRRVESQSSDRDKNPSETSFTQCKATLVDVSENGNNIFDRILVRELTVPSLISMEMEAISQRLFEQNNTKMTPIQQQLNSKFEGILNKIKTNRDRNLVADEEDAENNRPSSSNSENKLFRKNHASNIEIDKAKNQDNRFQSSKMYELRQLSTPFGVANKTLDHTIILNENRQEADYHKHYFSGRAFKVKFHYVITSSTEHVLHLPRKSRHFHQSLCMHFWCVNVLWHSNVWKQRCQIEWLTSWVWAFKVILKHFVDKYLTSWEHKNFARSVFRFT